MIDKYINIKVTLNEISVGGLLLTLSHEIYSRIDVLNTEPLITHLVLPSSWQSKEGVCDFLYENSFATVQPEVWQYGILA